MLLRLDVNVIDVVFRQVVVWRMSPDHYPVTESLSSSHSQV